MQPSEREFIKFQLAEAEWLDSVVRPLVPKPIHALKRVISRGKQRWYKRMIHFLIDYVFITVLLNIRITRGRNDRIVGGKGFRPGHQRVRLDSITTRVSRREKEIASKTFSVGLYY